MSTRPDAASSADDDAPTTTRSPATGVVAPALGLVLLAVVGAEFLLQLDTTIVNVALPAVQNRFDVGITTASWILNAFYLAFGGLLLLAGRLGDVLGHRKVFLAGIALVIVASLIAGLAPNVPLLLLGRGLQGVGAALSGPTGLALLTTLFEGERRQRAFGVYSTVTGLGSASGMVLGGLLTSAAGWRWAILINVPLGLVVLLVGLRTLGAHTEPRTERALGVPSALLVTAALGAGVYGLVNAADQGWTAPLTYGALIASVLVFALLAVVDRHSTEPLLPSRVFRHRLRSGGFVNLLLLAATLAGFLFFLAQYLAVALGLAPWQAGVGLLPFAAALLVSTQFVNGRLARIGLEARGLAGLAVLTAGLFWLSLVDAGTRYATGVLPPLLVIGLGVGVAIVPFNVVVLSSADPEDTGVTAGIVQAALTVGGLIGIAVLLLPYSAVATTAAADVTAPFAAAFLGSAALGVLGVLVALAVWFGPGTAALRRR